MSRISKITTTWAYRVRSGHIINQYVWHYYQSTINKSLDYPLVATNMTENQCKNIKYPDLVTVLKSAGLTSNFQIDIVAGIYYLLGLNNGILCVMQGHKQIYAMMNF